MAPWTTASFTCCSLRGLATCFLFPSGYEPFALKSLFAPNGLGSTSWGQPRSRLIMAGDDIADIADDALKYETYEQYLDSQVR
jgi:hypothetical protein